MKEKVFCGLMVFLFFGVELQAGRIKDIANVRGVRENQLVGYGLIVGLNGSGDASPEFTQNSFQRMLKILGISLSGEQLASKNVASVLVTATLPPFARSGNRMDVQVHSIGDAQSLKGGMLVQTPLRAANQKVYAVAQGAVLVGQKEVDVHGTSGYVPNGALVERDLQSDFAKRKMFRLTLHNPDFTTAARVAKVINLDLGGKYAVAKDSGTIDVVVPTDYIGNTVEFLATVEGLQVHSDTRAKVVINEKTGTVVIGEKVRISKVAVSHGNISVEVGRKQAISDGGQKTPASDRPLDLETSKKNSGGAAIIEMTASVGELVGALNALGIAPQDLIHILQNIKAAGALQGELEVL